MNAIREPRVRTFSAGFLTRSARTLMVCLVVLLGHHLFLSAQTLHYTKRPDLRNGEKVYKGGCIAWALADYACVWGFAHGRRDQRCDRVHAGPLQECPPRSAGRAKSATGIGDGEGVSRERDCDFYGGECIRRAGVDYGCH